MAERRIVARADRQRDESVHGRLRQVCDGEAESDSDGQFHDGALGQEAAKVTKHVRNVPAASAGSTDISVSAIFSPDSHFLAARPDKKLARHVHDDAEPTGAERAQTT